MNYDTILETNPILLAHIASLFTWGVTVLGSTMVFSWKRSIFLVLAITLHNIPEGLALGVAFGALSNNPVTVELTGAMIFVVVEE